MANSADDLLERADRAIAEAKALRLENQRIIQETRCREYYFAKLRAEIYGPEPPSGRLGLPKAATHD
jgi:hypothetical protein